MRTLLCLFGSLLNRFNIPLAQKVHAVLEFPDHVERGITELKRRVSASDRTKSVLYSSEFFESHCYNCYMLKFLAMFGPKWIVILVSKQK